MSKHTKGRLVTMAYLTLFPRIISYWLITVLPEILRNNLLVKSNKKLTAYAGLFFTAFLYGGIIGAFIWPYIIHYISKKNCLLLAIIFQMIFSSIQGCFDHIVFIFFCRFMAGIFNNIVTTGKDIIFDIAKTEDDRIFGFILGSCFTMFALFFGPYIGYEIYRYTGNSFKNTSLILGVFFLIGLILFLYYFYYHTFIPHVSTRKFEHLSEDEEKEKLLNFSISQVEGEKPTMLQTLKFCWNKKDLRNTVIVYILSGAVFRTILIQSVLYLETDASKNGLGIRASELSIVSLISYFPSVIVLFSSQKFVPRYISYQNFIRILLIIFSIAIFIIPLCKDLLTFFQQHNMTWIILLNQSAIYWSNPRIFSPFINYLINHKVIKKERTSLNSLVYILLTIAIASMVNFVFFLYTISLDYSFMQQFIPFNKYLSFAALIIFNIIAYCHLD